VVAEALLWGALLAGDAGLDRQAPEYEVKAHLLYNLSTTTAFTWPDSAFEKKESPFVLGILGSDPFGEEIDLACKGRSAQDRPIVIRRFKTLDSLETCHLLFISRSEKTNVARILAKVRGKPTLTVGEVDGFPAAGGAINFYVEESRVRFEINPKAAKRSGLTIRAKLLELGRIAEESP
jgi:hypothetical protein